MAFVETNGDVRFDDDLALDVVIGHAVRVGWQRTHPSMASRTNTRSTKPKPGGSSTWPRPGIVGAGRVIALRELAEQNGLVRCESGRLEARVRSVQ